MEKLSRPMKILEHCTVAPIASPSSFSLPLTFLDRIWLNMNPTSRLFFYEFQKPEPTSILLDRLKTSLSHTLRHFVPLAGQLTWPQDSETPVVQYRTGDGVSLTIAETNVDFYSLSGNEFRKSNQLRSFTPAFPTSRTLSPVMTLQITLFPDTGFSISYVAHHGVMDGKSISMFIHSWAYICNSGENTILAPHLTPSFDRSFIKQQEELENVYPKSFGKQIDPESRDLPVYDMTPPTDILLGTFILTREDIVTLKKSALAYLDKKNILESTTHVSTFMVTTAYVMVCLIKAKNIATEKTFIGINVNGRARLDPQLPSNYFGNCVLWCIPTGSPEEFLSQYGFFIAVERIIEAVATLNEGLVKLGGRLNDILPSVYKNMAGFIGLAGSPRFDIYKADFGWGRPKKVDMITIDKGLNFYLSDDRDGKGGIEIGLAMKKHEVELFTSIFESEIHACQLR